VATIGTSSAPVPPLAIYADQSVQAAWTKAGDLSIPQIATHTDSGWINGHKLTEWLDICFDPYTRDLIPAGKRRLLFLDGHSTHAQVEFLGGCWERNIVCVIFPANLSARFQPLDVDLFDHVKRSYHAELDKYLVGSRNKGVARGMFMALASEILGCGDHSGAD
jgi:hypothetical protein